MNLEHLDHQALIASFFEKNRAIWGDARMSIMPSEPESDPAPEPEAGQKPFAELSDGEKVEFLLAKTRKQEDALKGKSSDPDARALNKRIKQLEKENEEARALKESLEAASQTDAEKATKKAADEARKAGEEAAAAKVLETYGPRLVSAAFSVELAGRMAADDIKGLVADLNIARFLDNDGEADVDAVKAYVARIPAATVQPEKQKLNSGDLGGGKRSSATATSGADLYAQRHAKTTTN